MVSMFLIITDSLMNTWFITGTYCVIKYFFEFSILSIFRYSEKMLGRKSSVSPSAIIDAILYFKDQVVYIDDNGENVSIHKMNKIYIIVISYN